MASKLKIKSSANAAFQDDRNRGKKDILVLLSTESLYIESENCFDISHKKQEFC